MAASEVGESMHNLLLVCYNLMGLGYVILAGFQKQVFCGLIFQIQVLKVGLSNVGFKSFPS